MKRFKAATAVCCIAVAGAILAAGAKADDWNRKTEVIFSSPVKVGQPEALRAWFHPGRNWGEEFVYPKARAVALAKAGNLPVLFTPVDLPVEVAGPIKSASEPVVMELQGAR